MKSKVHFLQKKKYCNVLFYLFNPILNGGCSSDHFLSFVKDNQEVRKVKFARKVRKVRIPRMARIARKVRKVRFDGQNC